MRAVIGNGKSEYVKTTSRRFLWSLRQEVNIIGNDVVNEEQISEEARAPKYLVWLLRDLFKESNEDRPKEENEEKEGEMGRARK